MALLFGNIPALPVMILTFVALMTAVVIGTVQVFRAQLAENDYGERVAGLPTLNELRATEAALEVKRREEVDVANRLTELRREQAESERHRLDADHWRGLAEQAERDYASKQDKIREIDGIRAQYEEAANDLAQRRSELSELVDERDRLIQGIEQLKMRHAEAEALDSQIANRRAELETIRKEVAQLEDLREQLLRARFEVDQLSRQKSELENTLLRLPKEITQLTSQKTVLAHGVEQLKDSLKELRAARNEFDRLSERKIGLKTEIEVLEREKERLEAKVAAVGGIAGTDAGNEAHEIEQIRDLMQRPTCLFGDGEKLLLPNPDRETDETAFLSRVEDYLRDLHFDFEQRVLYRFHTSLKTAFISPLTVLAGISGTGKSQLPQRYAEAMGMHFLKVAVQPRWDSPQDLLGFYNYLEKSYKATELARVVVRMDRDFELSKSELHADDRILLVLLDEMNLARVEYYFSEFLSRLEGRPESDAISYEQRLPGLIEFDVPRKEGAPLSVYPGHNVLFVGTMNEDESTQALSDKVLDRANTLRFRKPEELRSETLKEIEAKRLSHLPFKTWYGWRRSVERLLPSYQDKISRYVTELNGLLGGIDRPFGHRVNQAIHAYVANYPTLSNDSDVERALADTLALRILPKLRGIELEDKTPQVLRQISVLARNELHDDELANSIDLGLSNTDVFHWTG